MKVADKKQRATLPETNVENGRNWGDTKETTDTMALVVFDAARRKRRREQYPDMHRRDDGTTIPVTVRFYMGRSNKASVVYCSIWCSSRDGERHMAGTGTAGGYGYCKRSAAMDEAIRSAGITLEPSIYGVGDSAMRDAIHAIGDALGFRRLPQVIV